jgi:spermidine/putrescine transport system substrate-binding protein
MGEQIMSNRFSRAANRAFISTTSSIALVVAMAGASSSSAFAQEELNALVWCDHTDAALIEPFEKANNVKVNLKEYEGTGTALSIISQSRPGDWDVFVIDGVDVPRAVEAGILAEMPANALPTADFFPAVVMKENNTSNGKTYAVTEKYGYNTISFDKTKVDPEDMMDMTMIWSDKYAGRIAIYDYYLPVIGLTGLGIGIDTADISAANMPAIKEKLLAMKAASKLVGDVVSSQTALATGEVDILVGGGEWVTAVLSAEKPDLDWVIPTQGGLRWSQSIGVMADSGKKDLALKFVQYITSPEGQARLATSSCFWGMPANEKAGAHLSTAQKAALRWDDQPGYLANSQLYPVPSAKLDDLMQDVWTEMLQH